MASYDLLIIGAGPAAWSCAMTARQRGLTTAVACAQSATSWLQRAERIDNYPGLPQISGKELPTFFCMGIAPLRLAPALMYSTMSTTIWLAP